MADGVDNPIEGQPHKLTVDEFAAKIKAKYPSYANIDNKVLTDKILAKYPQYTATVINTSDKPIVPNTLPSINQPQLSLSPLTGDARQEVLQQQNHARQQQQAKFREIQDAANPELRNAIANAPIPEQSTISASKKPSAIDRAKFGLKYITGNALKGVASSTVAPLYYYANKVGLASDEETKRVLDQVNTSDKETFGIKPENFGNVEGVTGAAGGLSKMLPALITAEGTGGASFALQNVGDAALQVQQMKNNGVKFDNHSDDLYINGMGLVGLALGRGAFGKVFSKLPSNLRNSVARGVVADAMETLGKKGADATAEDIANTFMTKAAEVPQRVLTHGIDALQTYAKVGTEMAGANIASFGLKNAANALNGDEKPFKDVTGEDFVKGVSEPFYNETFNDKGNPLAALGNIATSTAGQFGLLHGVTNSGMLFKGSPHENPIIEQLMENNSPQGVDNIKNDLAAIGKEKGLSDEEIDNTHKAVDVLAQTVGKLPRHLPKEKLQEGVSLIMGKNELEQELKSMAEERGSLDPSISDIPSNAETILSDKIDQANDKLRSLVTGDRITYSKGTGEDEGTFYKTLGGKKEEISESRYNLERLERDNKNTPDEQTQPNTEIPSEQPTDETVGIPKAAGQVDEASGDNEVKPQPPIDIVDEQGPRNTQTENTVQEQSNEQKPASDSGEKAAEAPVGEAAISKNKEVSISGHNFTFHGKPNESGFYFTDSEGRGAYGPKEVEKYGKPTNKNAAELLHSAINDFLKTPYGKESGLFKGGESTEGASLSPSAAEVSNHKAGDPLRAFADKVRQGKINKLGGFRASTGFDAAWDTSLEVVAKAAEGGAKIADAIEAGLKHIKSTDWYKNLTNKEAFDQQYRDHLSNEYAEVEKALPAKNEANEKVASELGLKVDESNKGKRTNEVIEKEAADAIKKGYNVPKLVDNILNDGHTATDTEVAILAKYRDAKYDEIKAQQEQLASEGATMSKKQFEALTQANDASLGEIQDVVDAIRKTGSITGSALRARQLDLQKEYSLGNMIAQKRQANGGEKLSSEELASVTKRFAEMEEIKKQLEARLKNVEEQNAKLKAEQAIKRSAGARRAVTKSELAAERSKIFDSIRDDFKKIRQSGQAMSDVPYRRELAAVAKHMPALLRNLAQEGVVRIEDVVDNIYTALKGDLEDITKRDVTDLIAGKYNEVKPTRSELQDNIKSLRAQAKLIAQIEDAEKGIKPTDKPPVVKQKNEAIDALKARLKELTKGELPSPEEKSLAALKKRLQDNIDKLSKKIAEGDYSKEEPKKPVTPDAEALALRRKYDKIKNEFDIEVAKDALKQRTKTEKLKDDLLNIASLPRALKASLDFSAVLRQGLFASVGHPKEALTAFKEMFRQTFSEEKYRNWISDLKHSEFYDLMKNSELYLSDKDDPKIIAREEEFTSNLADKIPGIGKAIAASERAYMGYLNVLRAGVFESQARELIKRGYTFENNPEVFKGTAKVINVLTGRGDVPEFLGGKTPKVLSNVLFSPRFMAARIQTLYLWADPRLPREAKLMAAKDIGATLGAAITLYSLASASGYKVVLDPRSSNFLKVEDKNENGSTYYDLTGGLAQYVRLLSQIATGQTVSSKGKVTDLSAKHGKHNPFGQTRGDVELRFLRGKLSPVIGGAINLQEGRDVIGNAYNFWPQVPLEFVPLPYTDVQEAYQVGGIKNALKVLLPSQFGVSVSSYNPNAKHK